MRSSDSLASSITPVLTSLLSYIATALLTVLMTLGCADVVGRYLLGRPIRGGLELTEMLLAAMIFVGLPLVSIQRGHVGLELLDSIAPSWVIRVQHWISHLVSGTVLMYLSWMLLQRAETLLSAGETTAIHKVPLYPLTYLMSACVALAGLVTFAIALQPAFRKHATGDRK